MATTRATTRATTAATTGATTSDGYDNDNVGYKNVDALISTLSNNVIM